MLALTREPLIECCIILDIQSQLVSKRQAKKKEHTAVTTRATIDFETSQLTVPSDARWEGKRLWFCVTNDTHPVKKRSRIMEIMIGLRYGWLRSGGALRMSPYESHLSQWKQKAEFERDVRSNALGRYNIIVVELLVDQVTKSSFWFLDADQKQDSSPHSAPSPLHGKCWFVPVAGLTCQR